MSDTDLGDSHLVKIELGTEDLVGAGDREIGIDPGTLSASSEICPSSVSTRIAVATMVSFLMWNVALCARTFNCRDVFSSTGYVQVGS